MSARNGRVLAIVASVVVAATLIAAVSVMKSPAELRDIRLDARRVGNLSDIVEAIDALGTAGKPLPADLQALASAPGASLSIVDPSTGAPYRYEVVDARRYRLCATFASDTARRSPRAGNHVARAWQHPAGEHCFDRERNGERLARTVAEEAADAADAAADAAAAAADAVTASEAEAAAAASEAAAD